MTTNILAIGRRTWEAIIDLVPALVEPALRKLAAHSIFSDYIHHNDSDRGDTYERVVISSRRLASIEGREKEHLQKRYVGYRFLDEFAQAFPGFAYTGWRMGEYPRQIDDDGMPDSLLDALREDLQRPLRDLGPAVDLWTGETIENPYAGRGAALRREREDEAHAEADLRRADAMCSEQGALLDLLNGAPGNTLAGIIRQNTQGALDAAARVGPKPGVMSRLRYDLRSMMEVRQVQFQPTTPYVSSLLERTVRVGPLVYPSAVTLRRPVRKAILAGCDSFDLSNCQLACAAAAWNVTPLLDLLGREGTAWPHLLGIVRDHHTASDLDAKGALKKAIYSTVFGMGRGGVRLTLGRALSFPAASAFMNDPGIEALFERRDQALAAIETASGARDCFGLWYSVRPGKDREAECRSALAATMQAKELQLLLPVIEDATRAASFERPQYRIVGWLHDGFYVKARYGADAIIRRLQRAVAREAARLGVPTGLDVERL